MRNKAVTADTGLGLKVFLNIPYDETYGERSLPAIITVCWAYGLRPFLLKEDVVRARLTRLMKHIQTSALVITDLSKPDRMNMPLESGMALAFGRPCGFLVDDQREKKRHISDLDGIDMLVHRNDPLQLMTVLSGWIEQELRRSHRIRRRCSVATNQLPWILDVNKAFLRDHGNLDLDRARRTACRIFKKWGPDDVREFANAKSDGTGWTPSDVIDGRVKALKTYAEAMA